MVTADLQTVKATRVAQAKAEAEALAAAETLALMELLEELQRSIAKRELETLKRISTMSNSRQQMLGNLFATYRTIETSIGNVTRTADKATAILQITKLIRPNGAIITPSRFLKTTKVTIPKEADGWGLLEW